MMLDRILSRAVAAKFAFAAISLVPSAASAATYLFNLTGNGQTASFSLNSSPVPTASGTNDFTLGSVSGTYNGSPTLFTILFYDTSLSGGLDLNSGGPLLSLAGPQLFTGTTANPTFILGNFVLSTYGSNDQA